MRSQIGDASHSLVQAAALHRLCVAAVVLRVIHAAGHVGLAVRSADTPATSLSQQHNDVNAEPRRAHPFGKAGPCQSEIKSSRIPFRLARRVRQIEKASIGIWVLHARSCGPISSLYWPTIKALLLVSGCIIAIGISVRGLVEF